MSEAAKPSGTDLGWTDQFWDDLLNAIELKECTPFLGAGASYPVLPLGRGLASDWAKKDGYPFPDVDNLPRVAQWLAVENGAWSPHRRIMLQFGKVERETPPNFDDPHEPHRVVADLKLPVYITTNYDNFMLQALQHKSTRKPRQVVCKWNVIEKTRDSKDKDKDLDLKLGFEPTIDEPVIFHLHGVLNDRDSMVLTEDDYVDFLTAIAQVPALIPSRIEEAFASTSLLFMGYSLEDMNFKVLFRKLSTYMRRSKGSRHVAVQVRPLPSESIQEQIERAEKQKHYLEEHFKLQEVRVYWGSSKEFATELRKRWSDRVARK